MKLYCIRPKAKTSKITHFVLAESAKEACRFGIPAKNWRAALVCSMDEVEKHDIGAPVYWHGSMIEAFEAFNAKGETK